MIYTRKEGDTMKKYISFLFALVKSNFKISSYSFQVYKDVDVAKYFKTKYLSDLNNRCVEDLYMIGLELGCRRFYPKVTLKESFQYGNYFSFIYNYLFFECGVSEKNMNKLTQYYNEHRLPKDHSLEFSSKDFISNVDSLESLNNVH